MQPVATKSSEIATWMLQIATKSSPDDRNLEAVDRKQELTIATLMQRVATKSSEIATWMLQIATKSSPIATWMQKIATKRRSQP